MLLPNESTDEDRLGTRKLPDRARPAGGDRAFESTIDDTLLLTRPKKVLAERPWTAAMLSGQQDAISRRYVIGLAILVPIRLGRRVRSCLEGRIVSDRVGMVGRNELYGTLGLRAGESQPSLRALHPCPGPP